MVVDCDTMVRSFVGIVVLNWNGRQDTLACLDSLLRCSYLHFRAYVVDDGSVDGTLAAIARRFGDDERVVTIQNGANLGFAEGNNVGMRRAMDDGAAYILLLNNDTVVQPDFLDPLAGALDRDHTIGVVTSKIYFHGTEREIWFFGGHMDRNTGLGGPIGGRQLDQGQFPEAVECDYATGCALMVRRELVERIGYLDTDYFYLAEDVDYCFRVTDAGYRVVAIPTSIVWHKVTSSLGDGDEAPLRLYYRARNRLLLVKKARNKKHPISGSLKGMAWDLRYLGWLLVRRRRLKGALYFLWGMADFLRGKVGIR